jgi:hypothetical protein
MTSTATRLASTAAGATVVTLGLATPALACTPDGGSWTQASAAYRYASFDKGAGAERAEKFERDWSAVSLAEVQERLDDRLADKLAWVDVLQTKVGASDRLDADTQEKVLTRLQAVEDVLTALRAEVAAADSLADVRAAVREAMGDPLLDRWWKPWSWSGWNASKVAESGDKRHASRVSATSWDHSDRDGTFEHRYRSDDHDGWDGDRDGHDGWDGDRDGDRHDGWDGDDHEGYDR